MLQLDDITSKIKELEEGINQLVHNHAKLMGMLEICKYFLEIATKAESVVESIASAAPASITASEAEVLPSIV